jgi:hypothetical protein
MRISPFRSLSPLFHVPLCVRASTGKELIYRDAVQDLNRLLVAAGCSDVADSKGAHGLRIGGATCAAAIGGDYVGGCLGLWASTTRRQYMWAMRGQIESACWTMSREKSSTLAVRPGPLGRYAH